MQKRAFYNILGVSPESTAREIQSAYRRLAKKYHPDTNQADPEAESRIKEINEAYRILGDAEARSLYDQGVSVSPGKKTNTSGRDARATKESDRPSQPRDHHVRVKLYLTIAQACKGGSRKIKYSRSTICINCRGSGLSSARGDLCETCSGKGHMDYEHTVNINYPAGVRPDETLVIAGSGHAISAINGIGDLRVTIVYRPHPYLEVIGNDLHYKCLIGLDQYIQGGRLNVPTIDGKTFLYLEPRMLDGETVNLSGRGLPARDDYPAGDLIITIRHCLPRKLSRKEMEKIKELMKLPGFSPPIDSKGFFPQGEIQ